MIDSNADGKNIDWKKKGLGWIPDYPDLRDYKLIDSQGDIVGKDGNLIAKGGSGNSDDSMYEFLGYSNNSSIWLACLKRILI
ncbi:MAG: hypothetical protein HC860_25980 [Alkalinema sp. RU_4_3]|nr:hypothetical protein [Alkalinema sp. RU_4_3]